MSARIPQDFIAQVLSQTDIVPLIQKYVSLKKKGAGYGACCPFHHEKTPSFTVSPTKQFYHCFGCGAHGNALDFLMTKERLSFREAVAALAEPLGLNLPQSQSQATITHAPLYALLARITHYYQSALAQNKVALSYLEKRGISKEMVARFQMGWAPPGWHNLQKQFGTTTQDIQQLLQAGMLIQNAQGNYYDRFRARLMFPITNHKGQIMGFSGRLLGDGNPKYLNSPQTPIFEKGNLFFGLSHVLKQHHLKSFIIAEGQMDVIALHQYHIPGAIGTLGTATRTEQIARLLRYCKRLFFCFDSDTAGQNAAWQALKNSLPLYRDGVDIRFIYLDAPHDPDSFLRAKGATAFQAQLQKAIPLSTRLLKSPQKLDTPDTKAAFVQHLKPLIANIPPGILKDCIIQSLADKIALPRASVATHLSQPLLQRPVIHKATQDPYTQKALSKGLHKALTLLLQFPDLAKSIPPPDRLQHVRLPHAEVLLTLLQQLQTHPNLSTGMVLEKWRETPFAELLNTLASVPVLTPESGVKKELFCALHKIIQEDIIWRIQILRNKSRQSGLTKGEKEMLRALLKYKHTAVSPE